ncbi:MAG TPA: hypothetical protein DCZ95_01320 [Verrucomicrobia bacterium]|nr:MAG: hypothetical protein A2X46_08960 [Lentisphaerae bacterium GWF2_57_35]HBA82708.1 hypothetical protein [Verrucomicrobiota bacterium]
MIYGDKTEILIRGLFEVQNEVGLGCHEEAYHKAFVLWLTEHEVPHASKVPHSLLFDSEVAHVLYPDIVAWDAITIELKAEPRFLRDEEHVQIFNYLKRRSDKLGLLANMGLARVQVERIIYNSAHSEWSENWKHWEGRIEGEERSLGSRIRSVLQDIFKLQQTGYGTEVLTKLILFGLNKRGMSCNRSPVGVALYKGQPIAETSFDCLVVENQILIVFTALFDDNEFNIKRGLSFMKSLGIKWGIAANFGKTTAQIDGLAAL